MRQTLLITALFATLLSGCIGTCASLCSHTALLTAVDGSGNLLTLQSVTENTTLGPAGCIGGPNTIGATTSIESHCEKFGIDAVSVDGKRFSGVIDVSSGTLDARSVCGTTCKTASVTITLN